MWSHDCRGSGCWSFRTRDGALSLHMVTKQLVVSRGIFIATISVWRNGQNNNNNNNNENNHNKKLRMAGPVDRKSCIPSQTTHCRVQEASNLPEINQSGNIVCMLGSTSQKRNNNAVVWCKPRLAWGSIVSLKVTEEGESDLRHCGSYLTVHGSDSEMLFRNPSCCCFNVEIAGSYTTRGFSSQLVKEASNSFCSNPKLGKCYRRHTGFTHCSEPWFLKSHFDSRNLLLSCKKCTDRTTVRTS